MGIVEANPQLAAAVQEALTDIDQYLHFGGTKLSSRPLLATSTFVKHFVLDIKGASKENAEEQQWFAVIFAIVDAWYKDKYGPALNATSDFLIGVVEIHGIPFKVRVPPTYASPGPAVDTVVLCFGPGIGAAEKPREWVEFPPSVDRLDPIQSNLLDHDLKLLGTKLRGVNLRFMTAEYSAEEFVQHRSSALAAIWKAAEHIARQTDSELGFAVWEVNYALENALNDLAPLFPDTAYRLVSADLSSAH